MEKHQASFILNNELTDLSITAGKARILCTILMQDYFDKKADFRIFEFDKYYQIALILEDYIILITEKSYQLESLPNNEPNLYNH